MKNVKSIKSVELYLSLIGSLIGTFILGVYFENREVNPYIWAGTSVTTFILLCKLLEDLQNHCKNKK